LCSSSSRHLLGHGFDHLAIPGPKPTWLEPPHIASLFLDLETSVVGFAFFYMHLIFAELLFFFFSLVLLLVNLGSCPVLASPGHPLASAPKRSI